MHNGRDEVKNQLRLKKDRLEQIKEPGISGTNVTVKDFPKAWARYEASQNFLDEIFHIENLTDLLDSGDLLELVTLPAMEKMFSKADYSLILFDGEYCKLAHIKLMPFPDLWMVWIAPISALQA